MGSWSISKRKEIKVIVGNITEIGTRWTGEGVERAARLLEEMRLNVARLEL